MLICFLVRPGGGSPWCSQCRVKVKSSALRSQEIKPLPFLRKTAKSQKFCQVETYRNEDLMAATSRTITLLFLCASGQVFLRPLTWKCTHSQAVQYQPLSRSSAGRVNTTNHIRSELSDHIKKQLSESEEKSKQGLFVPRSQWRVTNKSCSIPPLSAPPHSHHWLITYR